MKVTELMQFSTFFLMSQMITLNLCWTFCYVQVTQCRANTYNQGMEKIYNNQFYIEMEIQYSWGSLSWIET